MSPRGLLLDGVYLLAVLLLLPWVAWRRIAGGRPVAAPLDRFLGRVPDMPRATAGARIWLHGVSVGEVQLLASLAAEICRQAEAAGRRVECVASSSTTTGLEVAARRFGAEKSFPCPLDFSWAVAGAFDRIAPDLLVLGELELWPNLLAAARRRGIPVVVANARMSPRSARGYGRIRPLVRGMLADVDLVVARSTDDAARFEALGSREVVVSGSMKFDGIRGDREAEDVRRLATLAGFRTTDIVFLAGSTQAPEERLAAETFAALRGDHPRLRLVIVPRHVERVAEIAAVLDGLGLRWQRRSRLETDGPDDEARILLVDTTGELGWWWGTAAIAFVGGSLDGKRGGQNMLEPAAYAAAVSFGPFTRNFRDEVARLLAADAAEIVVDGRSLTDFVRRCLDRPDWAAGRGSRAAALVASQRGATATTAALVLARLTAAAGPESPA